MHGGDSATCLRPLSCAQIPARTRSTVPTPALTVADVARQQRGAYLGGHEAVGELLKRVFEYGCGGRRRMAVAGGRWSLVPKHAAPSRNLLPKQPAGQEMPAMLSVSVPCRPTAVHGTRPPISAGPGKRCARANRWRWRSRRPAAARASVRRWLAMRCVIYGCSCCTAFRDQRGNVGFSPPR